MNQQWTINKHNFFQSKQAEKVNDKINYTMLRETHLMAFKNSGKWLFKKLCQINFNKTSYNKVIIINLQVHAFESMCVYQNFVS